MKKWLSALLLAALFLSLSPLPSGAENEAPQSFPDVPTDAWYAEAVAAMKDSGIIMGCDDGLFHPEKLVTQGEFYAMLLRAGTFKGANISGGWKIGDHWAGGLLYVADLNGFSINGMKFESREGADGHLVWDGNGKLVIDMVKGNPDNLVSRTEAVTQTVELWWQNSDEIEGNKEYFKTYAEYMPGEPIGPSDIPDIVEIEAYLTSPAWDMEYSIFDAEFGPKAIAFAYNKGICKGVDETGTFDPDGLLTRAEIAQLLYNAGFTTRQFCLTPGLEGMAAYEYSFGSKENFVP